MKPPKSLRTLLVNSLDYAGLFPPAALELELALKNFASYVRSEDAWMLSTFVLPIGKFADAAGCLSEFDDEYPLRISALGPKTINEIDFAAELKNVGKGSEQLATADVIRVEQLEMPLPASFDAGTFTRLSETVGEAGSFPYKTFWEAPVDDAERAIELLAKYNEQTRRQPIGFKLRTGGVTADAFPSSAQIARALVAAAKHKVPIKFTAGLHHPVRMYCDEVKTKMHGFLNVLGAGVFAIEHSWDEEQTIFMLDDEDPEAFQFTDEAFVWRNSKITTAEIANHRRLVTSFGSCSFDEPREDLRALNLL